MAHTPCVTLYTFDKELTPESVASVNSIVSQLREKGIPKSFIQLQPLSNDRELAKKVAREMRPGGKWPLVFVDGAPACDASNITEWLSTQPPVTAPFTKSDPGEIEELPLEMDEYLDNLKTEYENAIFEGRFQDAERILKSIVNDKRGSGEEDEESAGQNRDEIDDILDSVDFYGEETSAIPEIEEAEASESESESSADTNESIAGQTAIPTPVPGNDYQLSYMGQTLEGIERGVVGVSSYMRSAMNLVGLSPTDTALDERFTDSTDRLTDRRPIAEFKVIQTNWYYRQQTRLLRFFQNCFVRVHPITDAVRSVHSYSDVTKVATFGASTFALEFEDAPQEYYQSAFTNSIVELLRERIPDQAVFEKHDK